MKRSDRQNIIIIPLILILMLSVAYLVWALFNGKIKFSADVLPNQISNTASSNFEDLEGNTYTAGSNTVSLDIYPAFPQVSGIKSNTFKDSLVLSVAKTPDVTALLVNDSADGVELKGANWTKTLPLVIGSQTFVVAAQDDNGRQSPVSITIIRQKIADINNDGEVGMLDFSALMASWYSKTNMMVDINEDGEVGMLDFSALMSFWGK